MQTISVLVVDDHAVFADAVCSLLHTDASLRPITTAYSLEEGCATLADLRPDVAVVDLLLSDGTGIELARRARTVSPSTHVVMLSAVDAIDAVLGALSIGVRVWLPKTAEPRRLVRAVHVAHRGQAWLPPDVLRPVLDALVERAASAAGPLDKLSKRELEVLRRLATGTSRSALASDLHLSPNTVRSHVQNIIAKLGVHTTLEAVAIYNRADLS